MKTKELLTIEFRYHDRPMCDGHPVHKTKTITIGIFDTIEDAVEEGNKCIKLLSNRFDVRRDDRFSVNGLFGSPQRLVTNTCYPTKGIEYFAKINKLQFADILETTNEAFSAFERYKEYKAERNY